MRSLTRSAHVWLLVFGVLLAAAGCKGGESPPAGQEAAGSAGGSGAPAPGGAPGSAQGQPASPGSATGQPPAPGAPAPGAVGSALPLTPSGPPTDVVAKVNGQDITRALLDFTIKNVVREPVPPEKFDQVRHSALDDLVNRELVYQKAKASQVSVSDAELAGSMSKIKSQFPDEKAFLAELAKDSMTPTLVESMVRQSMVVDKFVRSTITEKIKVSPDEETKFYQDNKEKMKHPEQVRASHILLTVQQGAPDTVKLAQKAKAEEALARARKGEDFAALAKQYSQDSGSRERGGDLGYFEKGRMVPGFEAAAWGLKVGEISGIAETQFGFHVIKVTDRRPEGYAPIKDVRERIHQYLSGEKTQGELQKLTEGLRAQAKIETKL